MNHPSSSPREIAIRKFKASRVNLLWMIGFTLLNILLFYLDSGTMFLFSATIPYFVMGIGIMAGVQPLVTICCIITAVTLVLYFVCWHQSKRHYGWLIVALVMFSLDCLFLLFLYLPTLDFSGIFDILIHAWVLYYLIIGVKYGRQLKNMPEPELAAPENTFDEFSPSADSIPLRRTENDVKFRVLLESEQFGRCICYRRVKRTNQLVIDGYIYDEVEMLFEKAHELSAVKDGHTIAAGYDGQGYSYLSVDGTVVSRVRRLI